MRWHKIVHGCGKKSTKVPKTSLVFAGVNDDFTTKPIMFSKEKDQDHLPYGEQEDVY